MVGGKTHIEFEVRRDFSDKLSVYFSSVVNIENGIKKEDATPLTKADVNQFSSAVTTSTDSIPQSGLLDNMVGSEKSFRGAQFWWVVKLNMQ